VYAYIEAVIKCVALDSLLGIKVSNELHNRLYSAIIAPRLSERFEN